MRVSLPGVRWAPSESGLNRVIDDAVSRLLRWFMPSSSSRRSPEQVATTLAEAHRRHPTRTQLQTLGQTHEGRPIVALLIGDALQQPDPRPVVLLDGAHHGGELLSVDIVLDAIAVLLENHTPELAPRVERFRRELVFLCVPEVNPDGVHAVLTDSARSDRKNARDNNENGRVDAADGVDLNRNYPYRWGSLGEKGSSSDPKNVYYRGPAAASEPETQAMMAAALEHHPVASISFHTGTVALLAPYTIAGAQNPEPNEAWIVAEELARQLPRHPQDRDFVLKKNLYPVDGTDQDWLRHELGTLALIVESARSSPKTAEERVAIIDVVRHSWMLLCDRFLDGPSVSGQVKNAAGEPVVATVRIAEQALQEGEVWTTRMRDGRFDRFLPGPRTYTIVAEVAGQPAVSAQVDGMAGRATVELIIPEAPASP